MNIDTHKLKFLQGKQGLVHSERTVDDTHKFQNSPGVELVARRFKRCMWPLSNAHGEVRFIAPPLVRGRSPALVCLKPARINAGEVFVEATMVGPP